MGKTQRSEYAEECLKAAWEKTQEIGKLADDAPLDTGQMLRELSHVVYRVGEAIVDQVAASSNSQS